MRYIIWKIWLKTGHNHTIQMDLKPYTKPIVTINMVPEMSNISEALDRPSMYQGSFFPPSM